MFARAGTAVGLSVCPSPCRARKATRVPDGSEAIVIGEEGYPHGFARSRSGSRTKNRDASDDRARTVSGFTCFLNGVVYQLVGEQLGHPLRLTRM